MTLTLFFRCGLISLASVGLMLSGCEEEDGCHCDDESAAPGVWLFVNECRNTDFTLSWQLDKLSKSAYPAISTLVRVGERCQIESKGDIRPPTRNYLDTCLWDTLGDDILLSIADSTITLVKAYTSKEEGQKRSTYHGYTAPWLVRNIRRGFLGKRKSCTWRITDAAIDSLARQARRAGLTPTRLNPTNDDKED